MRRIRPQLAVVFTLLAILPLLVFGVFAYRNTEETLRGRMETRLVALRDSKRQLLETWLAERVLDARNLAEGVAVQHLLQDPSPEHMAELRKRLTGFSLYPFAAYERIYLVSGRDGRIMASSRPADEGKLAPDEISVLGGDEPCHIGEAFCSGNPCQAFMHFIGPVFLTPSAEPAGAVVLEANLTKALSDSVLSAEGLGQTGEVMLVNRKGIALTPLRLGYGQPFSHRVHSVPIQHAASGESGFIRTVDRRGVEVIAAYSGISDIDWTLLVKEDVVELFRPIVQMRNFLLLVLGLSVAGAVGLAVVLSGRLTRPLRRLAGAAQKLSRGERDVTVETDGPLEVQETAHAFNRMAAEIRSLEFLRERMATAANHDLKGNLTPVKGILDMLAAGRLGPLEEKQLKMIEVCRRSTDRQLALVDHLTAGLRLTRRGVDLQMERVLVAEVLTELETLFRPVAEEAQVKLAFTAPPPDVAIRADRDRFGRILQNLISNAVKYTEAGGSVSVAAAREGGKVKVEVCDTGRGIAPEEQKTIFEPFKRGREAMGGGLGLGLWIVKTLVDAHGWTILVASQPDWGSSFTIIADPAD